MNSKNILISASLLASDFMRLGEETQAVIAAGSDWVHVDVMDGVFVPNITIGIPIVAGIKKTSTVPLDVHLMIVKPEDHIHQFVQAGADILTVHCEGNANIHSTLMAIRKAGAKPAVALNPGTPAEMVEPLLPFVDMVLVMTVNPGMGGQSFIPETLRKIRRIQQWIEERQLDVLIQVDGGIKAETVHDCHAAGASVFVAGTSIFCHPDGYQVGIDALRRSA